MMTLTECWSQSSFSVLLLAQDEFSCLKYEKERKRKQEKKKKMVPPIEVQCKSHHQKV